MLDLLAMPAFRLCARFVGDITKIHQLSTSQVSTAEHSAVWSSCSDLVPTEHALEGLQLILPGIAFGEYQTEIILRLAGCSSNVARAREELCERFSMI